jgi:hypothetical protein
MDPSQANPREYQRQAIDAEIKSLEESIRALRYRRNALAPISSLPTELIAAIFYFLRLPAIGTSPAPLGGKSDNHLAWICVAHVCRHWREIALDQPSFWSRVDFTNLTLAGAAEILARAKKAPLYLEARAIHWDDVRFSAFDKELLPRVSHIGHLSISTEAFFLRRTLEGLTSPAPTLEYLSLSHPIPASGENCTVPDTLFDSTTPRLPCLELHNCDISWKSPLLKGLRFLELRTPSENARPSLTDWLDALDEMPQLKRLVLHSASPIAPPFPFDVGRTVTLPFLTHLDISAIPGDCALALAHLVLPALTWLHLTVIPDHPSGINILKLFPYVTRHAHGPQDTHALQSVFIRSGWARADILVWPAPDIVVEVHDSPTLRAATLTTRVTLSVTNRDWMLVHTDQVLDAAMAALPLDGLVMLTVQDRTRLDEQFWLCHAPRWPLLQRVRLAAPAARGFRDVAAGQRWARVPAVPVADKTRPDRRHCSKCSQDTPSVRRTYEPRGARGSIGDARLAHVPCNRPRCSAA